MISNRPNHLYEFGPFVLNPAEHTLLRDGEPVPLRPKVFDTLLVLVERHSHLVEKDELLSAVWPGQIVEEGNLNKTISMLRQALGESAEGNRFIETVPKLGYRFVADVRDLNDVTAEELVVETRTRARFVVEEETNDEIPAADGAAVATAEKGRMETAAVLAQPAVKSRRRFKRGTTLVSGAVAVIVLAAAAYYFYPARNRGAAVGSVAVLPFINEGGDPEMEYLSDGISESLIESLSQLSGLKVIARNSSFKYKGKSIDAQEAARSLGVEAILTGKVLKRGDQVQINVELIDAANTRHWSEQYIGGASNLLSLQSEISRQIAGSLHRHLTAVGQMELAKRVTVNPVAYELLLKGRFYWQKGGTDNQKRGVEYFKQATEVDPAYALAFASLSLAYSNLVNITALDPKEFLPKAETAARKAVDLDENLAEAHLALAWVNSHAWDWVDAEREHKRAIESNPNLPQAHRQYTFYLTIHGRREEALAESRHALELDPLSSSAASPIYDLLLAGQADQAIEAAKKLLEADRSNPELHNLVGYTQLRKDHYLEAIDSYREAVRLGDDSTDSQIYLAEAYANAGQPEKARAVLKQLQTGSRYVSPTGLAIVHAALGEKEKAFELLERAYSLHDQQLIWLGVDQGYGPLRNDPRYDDLLKRIGLR